MRMACKLALLLETSSGIALAVHMQLALSAIIYHLLRNMNRNGNA